ASVHADRAAGQACIGPALCRGRSASAIRAGRAMTTLTTPVDTAAAPRVQALSPNQRAWLRFKRNRLGYRSLWIMVALLLLSAFAEVLCNDAPLIAYYNGELAFPVFSNPPETRYGGASATPTDWSDPLITERFAKPGNWRLRALNPHSATSLDYFQKEPNPAPPTLGNWLGTDSLGQDMVARLLYGFRVSILFGLAL